MALEDDLRTFVLGAPAVSDLVGNEGMHQGHVPEDHGDPYLYYGRVGHEKERALDDPVGEEPFRQLFTIECWGTDVVQVQDLARAVNTRLDGYSGPFGGSTLQGAFVDDQDDDYVPRNAEGDDGDHMAALRVELVPA